MNIIKIIQKNFSELFTDFLSILPHIIIYAVLILIFYLIIKVTLYFLKHSFKKLNLRIALIQALIKLINISLWIISLLFITMLVFPTFTPSKFVTAIGLWTVAIAFALKNIFENFMAGILILLREPFRLGDYIECGDNVGKITKITVRVTYLRRTDGQRVVLPNSFLFKNPVRILTNKEYRRIKIVCGLSIDTDIPKAKNIIFKALSDCKSINKNMDTQVFAYNIGSSSIDFEICWWTKSLPFQERKSRDEVIENVTKNLKEGNIEIHYPYQMIVFEDQFYDFLQKTEIGKSE